MSWLARLKIIGDITTPTLQSLRKGATEAFVGFVGTHPEPSQKSAPDDEIEAARLVVFTDRGLSMEEGQSIVDTLSRRDAEGDDRRLCMECWHLSGGAGGWRCSQWNRRQTYSADIPGDLVTVVLHRCTGFNDRLEAIA